MFVSKLLSKIPTQENKMINDCRFIKEDRLEYGPRAVSAYFRYSDNKDLLDQPGSYDLWEYQGHKYIVLGGGRHPMGFVAMYRIKNDGMLRRLKRFPKCIAKQYRKD